MRFERLTRAETLTAGLARPELLRDYGNFFHETNSFDVNPRGMTELQNVLCIDHKVSKRNLIWPLTFSFSIVALIAILFGIHTRSVSTGAEAGGLMGVAIVLLWTYFLWLLG